MKCQQCGEHKNCPANSTLFYVFTAASRLSNLRTQFGKDLGSGAHHGQYTGSMAVFGLCSQLWDKDGTVNVDPKRLFSSLALSSPLGKPPPPSEITKSSSHDVRAQAQAHTPAEVTAPSPKAAKAPWGNEDAADDDDDDEKDTELGDQQKVNFVDFGGDGSAESDNDWTAADDHNVSGTSTNLRTTSRGRNDKDHAHGNRFKRSVMSNMARGTTALGDLVKAVKDMSGGAQVSAPNDSRLKALESQTAALQKQNTELQQQNSEIKDRMESGFSAILGMLQGSLVGTQGGARSR